MIALWLALAWLAPPGPAPAPRAEAFEVAPRELAWDRLDPAVFDRRWTLPERRREGRDLLAEMRRLVALRVETASGRAWTFGDVVAGAREREGPARDRWLRELEASDPALSTMFADWGAGMRELLLDEHLRSDAWRPRRDHPRDGLLVAGGWELDASYGPPWSELAGTPRLEQAATLLHCDLATLKATENDYPSYTENVGSSYDAVFPLPGCHFRGRDPEGRPFSALTIHLRCELPFPYAERDCRLGILNRIADDGTPRTDLYSVSPGFRWMAGRDVFLAVENTRGERVAWLLVRHFGFDIDGVPDRSKHRVEALRESLGNLKRRAEARYRARAAAPGVEPSPRDGGTPEALTHFRVLGDR